MAFRSCGKTWVFVDEITINKSMSDNKNYKQALYTLVTVFFFWGFIAASNGVFIPFCKTYFSLDPVPKSIN